MFSYFNIKNIIRTLLLAFWLLLRFFTAYFEDFNAESKKTSSTFR